MERYKSINICLNFGAEFLFYYLEYLDYYLHIHCYTHKVSADMSDKTHGTVDMVFG